MIDFNQGFVKLSPISPADLMGAVGPMLVEGENIIAAFKGVRD